MANRNSDAKHGNQHSATKPFRTWSHVAPILLASACIVGCGDDERNDESSKSVYIPPVLYSYDHWDHHLLQWLPNHPRFEIVEALVRDEEPPLVHFFFTEREAREGSKRQIHYTNSDAFAARLADGAGDSEVYRVEVAYEPPVIGEKPTFRFGLDTLDGATTWQFCANAEPDPQYAPGLVNNVTENAHNPKGGLLFFYLPESATSDPCTALTVADETYPAEQWPEISVPPYFVAYRGVYSRNVDLGYFYTSTPIRARVDAAPSKLEIGAAWSVTDIGTTNDDTRNRCLQVLTLDGAAATISDGISTYLTQLDGDALATNSIAVTSGEHGMQVQFAEPLPDLRKLDEANHEVAFTIATALQPTLTTGVLSMQRTGKKLILDFRPQQPDFWQSTRLETQIELLSDGYSLESHTLYPEQAAQ